jgi:hypothetical protein
MRIRILVFTLIRSVSGCYDEDPDPKLSIWCCSGSGYGSRSYNSLLQIWTLQCSKMTLSKASTFSLWCGPGIRIQLSTLMRIRIQLPKLSRIRNTIVHCTDKDDTKPGLWYGTVRLSATFHLSLIKGNAPPPPPPGCESGSVWVLIPIRGSVMWTTDPNPNPYPTWTFM